MAVGALADDFRVPLAALEADGECPAGSATCALNALQRQARSTPSKDVEHATGKVVEKSWDDVEEAVFNEDEAVEDAGEEPEAGAGAEPSLVAVAERQAESGAFFSRRRGTTTTTTTAGSVAQCCLCRGGVISWSASGTCSHCSSTRILQKLTPKKACQSSKSTGFPGSRVCAQRCSGYFPGHGGNHVPMPSPRPCSITTDGSCRLFGCSNSRGGKQAVQCVQGKCVCKTGFCSPDGKKCVKS
uniref:Uncharacterized protein n=1 Tax=Pyrodinium bahamense TaxID=73915 RepID=A0A7S0FV09_9DINO